MSLPHPGCDWSDQLNWYDLAHWAALNDRASFQPPVHPRSNSVFVSAWSDINVIAVFVQTEDGMLAGYASPFLPILCSCFNQQVSLVNFQIIIFIFPAASLLFKKS